MIRHLITRLLVTAFLGGLAACHGPSQPTPDRPVAATAAGPAAPRAESCAAHFVAGVAPRLVNAKLAPQTSELCFRQFSVLHSGKTRTPLWSAEHLEARDVDGADTIGREAKFHSESRLPPDQRAELNDYRNNGMDLDRGHMVPSDDMPDLESQQETFSLANIVPQAHENNVRMWASIERAVRKMAKSEGDLYIVTGPAYLGGEVRQVGNVLVPTHLYKLVWSPRRNAGAAWFVENTPQAKPNVVPIPELERIIGIDLLPAVGAADKEHVLDLPVIATTTGKRKKS